MRTLWANRPVRNCFQYDYPLAECIRSLLPVCDKVSVCDAESTDGTQEYIREWMHSEPKLVLCVWKWPNPKGEFGWFNDWINYGREHCQSEYQFQMDCDEVLHENSYEEIMRFRSSPPGPAKVLQMRRYTFWKDHLHTTPDSAPLCANWVNRIAPQRIWLASDGYDVRGEKAASMAVRTGIEIFHYGFIRKRKQFFEKERALQMAWVGEYDKRLEEAESYPGNWMDKEGVVSPDGKGPGWNNTSLEAFNGTHPKWAHQWLEERGYKIPYMKYITHDK